VRTGGADDVNNLTSKHFQGVKLIQNVQNVHVDKCFGAYRFQ